MDLNLALGKAQHRALTFTLCRAVGLRRGQVTIHNRGQRLTVPYYHRGLERQTRVPAVFVHGFGGNKETWLMMATALPRRRPLVLVDLPGFGEASPIAPALASPGAQASSLLAALDAIGLPRADVVGSSMGGGISLRLARDAPERVRGLALICSVGPDIVEKSEVWQGFDRGENALIPKSEDDAARMLEVVMARPPRLPRSLMRYAASKRMAARAQLQDAFVGWMQSPPEDALPGDLDAIRAPTLVMSGQLDRVVHPAVAKAIARAIPTAELCALPDLGHMPQIEAPRRSARVLERFLAQLD